MTVFRAPLGGPAHFLDLLLDARSHGGIANVGVDLHEEVAANDHRLEFGMIDVGRDDGPARRHLASDELWCYLGWNFLRETGKRPMEWWS